MHRASLGLTRSGPKVERRNGPIASSLTQKLSLIDNHLQMKVSFFKWEPLGNQTTLKTRWHALQPMLNRQWAEQRHIIIGGSFSKCWARASFCYCFYFLLLLLFIVLLFSFFFGPYTSFASIFWLGIPESANMCVSVSPYVSSAFFFLTILLGCFCQSLISLFWFILFYSVTIS